jgi:uncharacterized ferritin-like protein (DUF455 family)
VRNARFVRLSKPQRWTLHASADVLRIVYHDEIGHVEIGRRWFEQVCHHRGLSPITEWHDLVRRHHRGLLKRPFNDAARLAAGFDAAFYEPLAEEA